MSTAWFGIVEGQRVESPGAMDSGAHRMARVAGARRSPRVDCGPQLDLAMPAPPPAVRRRQMVRPCSRERAAWWFDQMRRAVDGGREIPVQSAR